MTDAPKPKTKLDWTSWRNRPYASGDDQRKKQAEAFDAMNAFVRKHGGSIVSPPGNKTLRVEIMRDSSAKLTDELTRLGYRVMACGSTTRITGAPASNPRTERLTGEVPSAFAEMDVLEIRLDGK